MPFMKYASARVVTPNVTKTEWRNVRVASTGGKSTTDVELSGNLVTQASEFLGEQFDPKKYLLTHATIIASVDTISPPGTKTGSVEVDGFKVNRKFSNFRIKPESDQYINNNKDAWDRPVLAKSHKTFIGGHNFVEHVQVEELSKGRIIDAVSRDIGDSIYVDILIATSREHEDLVKSIESGKMATLSMGCTVDGTICTKCGNWAADETEMCPHIKYQKGNIFFDENGRQHRIAELCGHESLGPTGGVHFIEASWVETPAFTGAVLRNVLDITTELSKKAKKVLSTPPAKWSKTDTKKAASTSKTATDAFLAGWDDGSEAPPEDAEAPAATPSSSDPLKDVEDSLYNRMKERVINRLNKDMDEPNSSMPPSTNETLVKQASFAKRAYVAGINDIVRTASSDAELIDRVASFNGQVGIKISVDLYRASLKVGPTDKYQDVSSFNRACRTAMGRNVSTVETRTLVRLGQLLTRGYKLRGAGSELVAQGVSQ